MAKAAPGKGKRAVVVIHGIGSQTPLDTLRGLVEAVWHQDQSLTPNWATQQSWVKPEDLSEGFELRRITTSRDKFGLRTDFFEFYWAHQMEGTRLSSVLWWFRHP
jgi:hypothetical protein